MRMVDADALQEAIVSCADLSTKTVDVVHDLIDAAPTISCRTCGFSEPGHEIVGQESRCTQGGTYWGLDEGCSSWEAK